jgi:hypothetical protein
VLGRHIFCGCGRSDVDWGHVLSGMNVMMIAPGQRAVQTAGKGGKREASKLGPLD